jgi:16S rRNA processing protein RimM
MTSSRLVPVGKIVKTHGLQGALKIVPYGETLGQQELGVKLCLYSSSDEGGRELTLVHLRSQGRHYVAQFAEFSDVDTARDVVEQEVFLPEECLPPTSEGEYYHYQLIGLRVETAGGREIGILRGIIETGSNDVYVVAYETKEILIPAIAEVILEVDLQRGKLVIEPPEGLLDDL